jgi:hypothetical protein
MTWPLGSSAACEPDPLFARSSGRYSGIFDWGAGSAPFRSARRKSMSRVLRAGGAQLGPIRRISEPTTPHRALLPTYFKALAERPLRSASVYTRWREVRARDARGPRQLVSAKQTHAGDDGGCASDAQRLGFSAAGQGGGFRCREFRFVGRLVAPVCAGRPWLARLPSQLQP